MVEKFIKGGIAMKFFKILDKKPLNKGWQKEDIANLKAWEAKGGLIGWAVSGEYVVIDVDDEEDSKKLLNIVKNCGIHKTNRGYHFIYKKPRNIEIKNWSKKICMLGCDIDYRVKGGYIVYPNINTPDREIIKEISNDIDYLPEMFYPLDTLIENTFTIQEGERDTRITSHYGRLLNYDLKDPENIIHNLNQCLDSPLDADQIEKIIKSIGSKEKKKLKRPWISAKGKVIPQKLADYLAAMDIIHYNKKWYKYEKGVYEEKRETEIDHLIRKHGCEYQRIISEVRYHLKLNTDIGQLDFNNHDDLIIFNNIALKDFKQVEFNPDYKHSIRIPIDYDENVKAPLWEEFLSNSLTKVNRDLLQEMFGYFLTTSLKAKGFFMLYGPTDSGKSVIADLLTKIIGHNKVSNASLQNICDPSDRWAAGELHEKLVNINTDISDKPLKDTNILKQLTGDGRLRYEMKGLQPFSDKVTARMLFLCNELPQTRDRDNSYFNRINIIEFTKSIPKQNQDKSLVDKLYEERQGIINWALEGLKRLVSNNYELSGDINLKQEYKETCSPVVQFVKECCRIETSGNSSCKDLYANYKQFCNQDNYRPLSQIKFSRELLKTYPQINRKKSSVWQYEGIVLNDPVYEMY